MNAEKQWHVVYVQSRSEKKVAERMTKAGIMHYLPMVKTLRQWSDRKKLVQTPLINGYIFVHCSAAEFTRVRMVPGVVLFVLEDGKPARIPENQILLIQQFIENDMHPEMHADVFAAGEKVRIIFGPMSGMTGELVRIQSSKKVIIRLEAIHQVISIELPKKYLEKA